MINRKEIILYRHLYTLKSSVLIKAINGDIIDTWKYNTYIFNTNHTNTFVIVLNSFTSTVFSLYDHNNEIIHIKDGLIMNDDLNLKRYEHILSADAIVVDFPFYIGFQTDKQYKYIKPLIEEYNREQNLRLILGI